MDYSANGQACVICLLSFGEGHPEAGGTLCHSHPWLPQLRALGLANVIWGRESGCLGNHGGKREVRDGEGRWQALSGKV